MAISDSHRLGQQIGNMLEKAMDSKLESVLPNENFYLDKVNTNRQARGDKRKVTWVDYKGDKHDLDFVIEQHGSFDCYGRPKAFIECAWRRYTKHSKNKAQEIQGAIIPLQETYHHDKPFLGVILAGEFTEPSLRQLRNSGFTVLYITYQEIIQAYSSVGMDVSFNENTDLDTLKQKADDVSSLDETQINVIINSLYGIINDKMQAFLDTLSSALRRTITLIIIQPLFSVSCNFTDIETARQYLINFNSLNQSQNSTFDKFFIYVEYNNGDNLKAEFKEREDALQFLEGI